MTLVGLSRSCLESTVKSCCVLCFQEPRLGYLPNLPKCAFTWSLQILSVLVLLLLLLLSLLPMPPLMTSTQLLVSAPDGFTVLSPPDGVHHLCVYHSSCFLHILDPQQLQSDKLVTHT